MADMFTLRDAIWVVPIVAVMFGMCVLVRRGRRLKERMGSRYDTPGRKNPVTNEWTE